MKFLRANRSLQIPAWLALLILSSGCGQITGFEKRDLPVPDETTDPDMDVPDDSSPDETGEEIPDIPAHDEAVEAMDSDDPVEDEPPETGDTTEEIPTCEFVLTPIRTVFDDDPQSFRGNEPEVITLDDGSFYLLSAVYKDHAPPLYENRLVEIAKDGASASDPIEAIEAARLPGYHPLFTVNDGVGSVFRDMAGMPLGRNLKLVTITGLGGFTPLKFVGTLSPDSGYYIEAVGVDNGSNVFVAINREEEEDFVIEGLFVDYNGEAGAPTLLARPMGPRYYGQPAVAYNGETYMVAYFSHLEVNIINDSDAMKLVEVDGTGEPTDFRATIPVFDLSDTKVVGRPSIVWTDEQWFVLWQESFEEEGGESHLHLTRITSGGITLDSDISSFWEPDITEFVGPQPGELDMVWTGEHVGIVLKHNDAGEDGDIYFTRFESDGMPTGEEPVPVSRRNSMNCNPAITYTEDETGRYYLITWLYLEPGGEYHTRAAVYGCVY